MLAGGADLAAGAEAALLAMNVEISPTKLKNRNIIPARVPSFA